MAVEDGRNSRYGEGSVKVLHLLKQPTMDNPSMPKLVDDLTKREKLGWKFMYRLAIRSYALQNGFLSYGEVKNESKHNLVLALQRSAIVNLENNEFSTSTDKEAVLDFAIRNKDRWYGKILELQPDFVVCGGTFDAVWRALDITEGGITQTGMKYFYDPEASGVVYLGMCHPSAHYPLGMKHTFLVESAKELYSNPK